MAIWKIDIMMRLSLIFLVLLLYIYFFSMTHPSSDAPPLRVVRSWLKRSGQEKERGTYRPIIRYSCVHTAIVIEVWSTALECWLNCHLSELLGQEIALNHFWCEQAAVKTHLMIGYGLGLVYFPFSFYYFQYFYFLEILFPIERTDLNDC